jgi:hypothetical protein
MKILGFGMFELGKCIYQFEIVIVAGEGNYLISTTNTI